MYNFWIIFNQKHRNYEAILFRLDNEVISYAHIYRVDFFQWRIPNLVHVYNEFKFTDDLPLPG